MPDYTPEGIRQTCDLVFDKCPDVITTTAAWGDPTKQGAEVRKPVFDPLVRQGMKYCQMTVMTRVSMAIGPQNVRAAEDTMQDEVRYYNSLGIKPEFMAHNEEAIENVKRWLMNQDLLQKPYVIYASMGMHHSTPGVPGPWSSLHLLSMLHYMPPNTFVGVSIGGRNWLPLTVQAITWGVDYVRIGMEDTCWLYPHLDEMIRKNVQVVSKIVNIAKELGREIATPDKARELMGLKKP
jgi:3-keto-5-aminohexanoate cleavage enzyme